MRSFAELPRENTLRERPTSISDDVHGLGDAGLREEAAPVEAARSAGEELGLVEDVLVAEYGPCGSLCRSDGAPVDRRTRVSIRSRGGTHSDQRPASGATADRVGDVCSCGPSRRRARLAKAERKLAQLGRVNPLARGIRRARAASQVPHHASSPTSTSNRVTDPSTIIEDRREKMEDIF
jgi:chromosome segregation protein